jgi:hypothetical protein
MITGVETAGLILAVFPILVQGLKAYAQGINTIRLWRSHLRILRQFARDIEGERVVYLNTLEELFIGIASSEEELTQLLDNPGGDLWRQEEYNFKLHARLDHSYDTYVSRLLDLLEALNTLSKKLGISNGGTKDLVGL